MPADRAAFGAFLRARRDLLSPAQAGVRAVPGRRRVPGLRREELAALAGLSPDYYGRLEQGRQAAVGDSVLEALATALRLDDTERAHLHALAAPAVPRHGAAEAVQRADPGLLRLLTTLDHVPALLLGRGGTVLASNALLGVVLGRDLEPGSSFLDYLFRDPLARERIVNWPDFASSAVAALRGELGRRPWDTRLTRFVDELRADDADAARWWDDTRVRDYTSVAKQIAHPVAGPLRFDLEVVSGPHDPDQRLVVYTAEPDSATARCLPLLRSWTGEAVVGDHSQPHRGPRDRVTGDRRDRATAPADG